MPDRNRPTASGSLRAPAVAERPLIVVLALVVAGFILLAAAPRPALAADPGPSAGVSADASPAASATPPSPSPSPSPTPTPTPSPSPPPVAPVAAIGPLPSRIVASLPATFKDASTGTISSRTWAFGDGGTTTTTATSVSHTYAAAGTYTIKLTVTGPGGKDSASADVVVTSAFRIDLFRRTAYVRQFTSTWCVGAAAQMMANLSRGTSIRTYTRQQTLMRWARAHDTLVASRPGSDPRGWAWALRHAGAGPTYQYVNFTSRQAAIEYAARRLMITHRPVGILAWRGAHAWVMTGFVAAANPTTTSHSVVAAVIVSGPLGSPRDPYDRVITVSSFGGYFLPYAQRDGWRGWIGKYVVVAP